VKPIQQIHAGNKVTNYSYDDRQCYNIINSILTKTAQNS